jgi:RNA polymerase sigma factor (sigma-70 family)
VPLREPNPTDAELVARAARNDRAAFGVLYDRHAPALVSLLSARFPAHDPEDLAHTAVLRAMEHITQFEGTNFRAWLFRVGLNAARDRVRLARPVPLADDVPGRLADPSADLIGSEREAALRTCLGELEARNPRGARIVRGLLGGEPYDQLLPALGLTPAAAYRLKHVALKILQECVARNDR